tara:strand:- start:304 stop:777 length:474 start_codon:yes stop_codon:yes gene_type:complete
LTGIPGELQAVKNFDIDRYAGTWYELYRLDHPFERGLSHVTATYTRQEDGSVKVENEGMKGDGSMSFIEGRAEFQGDTSVGSLKVSFFGPFFSGYHIIALDEENYDYAMIAGGNFNYLWILSRTPQLDEAIVDRLLMQAEESGYVLDELIMVDQTQE